MTEPWLTAMLATLQDSPFLQGILVVLGTFILEDPTTVGSGLLVADGKMAFLTALAALTLGIALGDLGLYGLGRYLGPRALERGWISEDRFRTASEWMQRNLIATVLVSRFVPGTRLPTFVAAGVLRVSVWRFLAITVIAVYVWTLLLLWLAVQIGEAILPLLGSLKWPLALAALGLLVLSQVVIARRLRRRELAENDDPQTVVSFFEFWPPYLFYIPVLLYYLWLALKHRSFTLPTCANPSIYSGGFSGESKWDVLRLVPDRFQEYVPRMARFRRKDGESAETAFDRAAFILEESGIGFPFVAKPDQGQRGSGVQKVYDREQLRDYLRDFPYGPHILFQELVDYPHEAGLFFVRRPGAPNGKIISTTLKHFPAVTGDGKRTLCELIEADPRARRIRDVYFERNRGRLDHIPDAGRTFPLVFAGNHCRGAIFKDGQEIVTPKLEQRIHEIATSIPEYYFGRFDVRYRDRESFQQGENFKIVEINGATSEATHIWDAAMSLREAYRVLFRQFRLLFEIGESNRRRGCRPLGIVQVARDLLAYHRIARHYPPTN